MEFWITLEIILFDVNHGHWYVGFGIEVKQTDYTFQLNKYFSEKFCFLRGRIDNACAAFIKYVSILQFKR